MKIHALQTGTVTVKTCQVEGVGSGFVRPLKTMLDREWTAPLPILAWVIEHPEGLIVVDTGETARASEPGYFPNWHPYFRLAVRASVLPEQEIGPQMRAVGLSPADVRFVVMTHLHTDHAGGLSHFPKSEILVSRPEFEAASGLMGKLRGYLPQHWPNWFEPSLIDFPEKPFGPFGHSKAVTKAADVWLVATPGHSPGHLSVIVQNGSVSYFLAGDTSYTEALMLTKTLDGVAPDPTNARVTLDRLVQYTSTNPTVYLPSHDPAAASRLAEKKTVAQTVG